MCGTHKVISCFIKVLPFSSVSMTTDKHTPPFRYGFHSLFFTMHLWVCTSPGECGRHLLVGCLLCPSWFSSVDVKHFWHVEDALTGLLVPKILFLTDPQNSYFFKKSCSPPANEQQGRSVRKLVFLLQKKKMSTLMIFHLI